MSQLRKNLKFGLSQRWRSWKQRRRLKYLGKKVWIDKDVAFMRFPQNISVGDDVVLKRGAHICSCNKNANIIIGTRTTVGYHVFIFASKRILIGNDCLIAPFVYIVDSNHSDARDHKINEQTNVSATIEIGNDVWIASGVTILKGVRIADGAIVAANSVVNCDIGSYEIWGGSPAKKIGDRK